MSITAKPTRSIAVAFEDMSEHVAYRTGLSTLTVSLSLLGRADDVIEKCLLRCSKRTLAGLKSRSVTLLPSLTCYPFS